MQEWKWIEPCASFYRVIFNDNNNFTTITKNLCVQLNWSRFKVHIHYLHQQIVFQLRAHVQLGKNIRRLLLRSCAKKYGCK